MTIRITQSVNAWDLTGSKEVGVRLSEMSYLYIRFFGLYVGWLHNDSAVVSDSQGVGGVLDVCISVQCTHSPCQKQCNPVQIRNMCSSYLTVEEPRQKTVKKRACGKTTANSSASCNLPRSSGRSNCKKRNLSVSVSPRKTPVCSLDKQTCLRLIH